MFSYGVRTFRRNTCAARTDGPGFWVSSHGAYVKLFEMGSLAFCSWSGGKDCALAIYRARQSGLDVRFLLAMMDESGAHSRSHAVPLALLEEQARSLGCELITRSASWKTYEAQFLDAARELRERGAAQAVFGDIDLQAHRDWEQKVCAQVGVEAVLPLWNENRRDLAEEVLDLGFKAKVVCVGQKWLGHSFCGRDFDRAFIEDLPPDVDWCGEDGEFHTFVFDGPGFQKPLSVEVEEIYEQVLPPEMGAARFWFARLRGSR